MKSSTSAEKHIVELCGQLGDDERTVLARLAERLRDGQAAYGRLDLARDSRDWTAERAAELEDVLIYSAFEAVKRAIRNESPPRAPYAREPERSNRIPEPHIINASPVELLATLRDITKAAQALIDLLDDAPNVRAIDRNGNACDAIANGYGNMPIRTCIPALGDAARRALKLLDGCEGA